MALDLVRKDAKENTASEISTALNIDVLKSSTYVSDFEWTSASQVTMPASSIFINGVLYTNNSSVTFDFANGTGTNGLDTGTEQSNQWYALYAIPSGSGFTLKASTSLSGPSGFAQYRYLGLFRNGNGDGASTDIIRFIKNGSKFSFIQRGAFERNGMALAQNNAVTSITYTFVIGMAGQVLPWNKTVYTFLGGTQADSGSNSTRMILRAAGGVRIQIEGRVTAVGSHSCTATMEVGLDTSVAVDMHVESNNSETVIVNLVSWIDPVLARAGNK